MATNRIYPVDLSNKSNKSIMVNNSGDGLTSSSLSNTINISKFGGDFDNLEDAFNYIKTKNDNGFRILLDSGIWNVSNTITVSCTSSIYMSGNGANTTVITPTVGMLGNPIFALDSTCDITNLEFNNTGLTSWGISST